MPETTVTAPPTLSDAELAEAIEGLNGFAFDFHRRTASSSTNAVASGLSVALALAMVHAGAKGETADEIARALRLPTEGGAVEATAASVLSTVAEGTGEYELSIVDRLFGDQRVPFEPSYLALARDVFAAPLETQDFVGAPEPARAHINAWVAEQTRDRIRDLLPGGSVTPATKLVLVNAIYFKARWMDPFMEGRTAEAPFFAPSGRVTAKMMSRTGFMRWAAPDAGVQLVELPYEDGELAMVLALPDARDGLDAVEKGLDGATWTRWMDALQHERVALSLPKFRIEMPEPLRLRRVCEAMGIVRAFDYTRADFTAIAPASEQLEISEGFHKAFIEVDEKGTEAAAATALGMRAGAAMPTEPPKSFVCDRPFAYAIRDTRTSAILFYGHVTDPSA